MILLVLALICLGGAAFIVGELITQPAGLEGKWRGPYMEQIPKDSWGQEITIENKGETFVVSSPVR